jgi:hypothetical protein
MEKKSSLCEISTLISVDVRKLDMIMKIKFAFNMFTIVLNKIFSQRERFFKSILIIRILIFMERKGLHLFY